jgi:hypothetical protein
VKLIILLLLAVSLRGQNAVATNYTPTVLGMTIGTYYCYFWFKSSATQPYNFESACYSSGTLQTLQFGTGTAQQVYQGISWLVWTTTAGLNYQISGEGPSDTTAVVLSGIQ